MQSCSKPGRKQIISILDPHLSFHFCRSRISLEMVSDLRRLSSRKHSFKNRPISNGQRDGTKAKVGFASLVLILEPHSLPKTTGMVLEQRVWSGPPEKHCVPAKNMQIQFDKMGDKCLDEHYHHDRITLPLICSWMSDDRELESMGLLE